MEVQRDSEKQIENACMVQLEAAWRIRRKDHKETLALCEAILAGAQFQALTAAQQQDVLHCVECLKGLIAVYLSDYPVAKELLDQALAHLRDGHLPLWLARCANSRGYLFSVTGQFGDALVSYREALDWSRAVKDFELIVFILFNIGELYREVLERYQEANSYYEEALHYALEGGGHTLLSSIYSNLGATWQRLGDKAKAWDFAQLALQTARQNQDAFAMGVCYDNLSTYFFERGELDRAWEYVVLADQAKQPLEDDYADMLTWLQMARIEAAKGRHDAAIEWGKAALKEAVQHNSGSTTAIALGLLARAYEYLGDTRRAMLHYKAYSKKAAEKFSLDLASQMTVLTSEAKFTALKKDAEIHRLRNVELKNKTEEIERVVRDLQEALASLKATQQELLHAEKMAALGRLVAGVAHEINTPLGVSVTLASFIQAQLEGMKMQLNEHLKSCKGLEEPLVASQEAVEHLENSLQRTADIVRSFKNLAMTSELMAVKTIALEDWLKEFALQFESTYGGPLPEICILGEPIVLETYPNALGAILTELCLNARYHAYPEGGAGPVRLTFSTVEGSLRMICCDEGMGLSDMVPETLFEPFVTTKRREGHIGLGLHSVFNIVKQILKGDIQWDQRVKGVCLTVTCPLRVDK